eukprot:6655543-Prymnesium_polylepis.3
MAAPLAPVRSPLALPPAPPSLPAPPARPHCSLAPCTLSSASAANGCLHSSSSSCAPKKKGTSPRHGYERMHPFVGCSR